MERVILPDYVTKEWVLKQKKLGKSHAVLAKELYISYHTFLRTLRRLGFKSGDFDNLKGYRLRNNMK